jgi:hypothetical protein
VPAESPTLGFTHLQFEALFITARESGNPCDFALVAMLRLPGLRIFEATGADITISAKNMATGCSASVARGSARPRGDESLSLIRIPWAPVVSLLRSGHYCRRSPDHS